LNKPNAIIDRKNRNQEIKQILKKIKNMKTKTILFSLLIMSAVLWTGCSQEGPAGIDGIDGNANVTASPWYTPNAWKGTTGNWYFNITNPEISQDIVEGGAILAYVNLPGDLYNESTVRPLPAYAIGANWDFLLPNDGQLYGNIEFTSDMVNRPGTTGYNFRFILISSNYTLKSATLNTPGLNDLKKMSYKDVCKLFGIKE